MKVYSRATLGAVLSLLASSTLPAQDHASQFELTRAFVTDWAHGPVRDVAVNLFCGDPKSGPAGPVHAPDKDCELHTGAQLSDPSISDFQGVVLEPPNVCAEQGKNWRTAINAFANKDCVAHGFVRVWPEHLTSGSGCSNPNHFMELHPLQTLKCGGTDVLDFTSKLRVVEGLGYKSVSIVRQMMGLQLWVCEGCGGGSSEANLTPIEFDYCFGANCKRGQASNFARFQAKVLPATIRPKPDQTLEGFATAIARVLPVDQNGQSSGTRFELLKLYALKGSDFYDKLLAIQKAGGTPPPLDIIGIFTVEPLSVLKVIEKPDFPHATWVSVPFPVALVVFGETP
ncbi:MAG TPA: hypothetical protein VHQ90_02085 [Thermoanaerobaculia bacterium]|nr:hypothetical protein [Thermoanaerobaculia bacterium]